MLAKLVDDWEILGRWMCVGRYLGKGRKMVDTNGNSSRYIYGFHYDFVQRNYGTANETSQEHVIMPQRSIDKYDNANCAYHLAVSRKEFPRTYLTNSWKSSRNRSPKANPQATQAEVV